MSIPNEAFVQVAPDGSGKRMRNALRYVQQADGTMVPVYEELVQLVGPEGNPVDFENQLSDLGEAVTNLTALLANAFGLELHQPDIFRTVPSVTAQATLRDKVTPFSPVRVMGDMFGRQVMLPVATRDMVLPQSTTISASTAEATIGTAQPSYLDLVMLIISNTSTSTTSRVDIRDTTGGPVLFSLQSVGGAAPVGFALPIPIPQTTPVQNWTAQCGTSTTDIRVYGVWIKNK